MHLNFDAKNLKRPTGTKNKFKNCSPSRIFFCKFSLHFQTKTSVVKLGLIKLIFDVVAYLGLYLWMTLTET